MRHSLAAGYTRAPVEGRASQFSASALKHQKLRPGLHPVSVHSECNEVARSLRGHHSKVDGCAMPWTGSNEARDSGLEKVARSATRERG